MALRAEERRDKLRKAAGKKKKKMIRRCEVAKIELKNKNVTAIANIVEE